MNLFYIDPQNLRDEIVRLKSQLAESNHKLCQLQTFRTSVARLLHLRDIPHSSLLQRLQGLCNAHQVILINLFKSSSIINCLFFRSLLYCRAVMSLCHLLVIIHVRGMKLIYSHRLLTADRLVLVRATYVDTKILD